MIEILKKDTVTFEIPEDDPNEIRECLEYLKKNNIDLYSDRVLIIGNPDVDEILYQMQIKPAIFDWVDSINDPRLNEWMKKKFYTLIIMEVNGTSVIIQIDKEKAIKDMVKVLEK